MQLEGKNSYQFKTDISPWLKKKSQKNQTNKQKQHNTQKKFPTKEYSDWHAN